MDEFHTSTGTAADLLTYYKYHNTAGYDYLTRVATASQEWIVGDWDGETYCIRFDKNFSKKHLFTFSKKDQNQHSDVAKHDSLHRKVERVLDVRANIKVCKTCNHPEAKHKTGAGAWTPCKVVGPGGVLCGCTPFVDAAGADVNAYYRAMAGKPDHNVLGGAGTKKNTCIVLNYVPKAEFEAVIVGSIRAVEKPALWNAPGQPYDGRAWRRGDPLAVNHLDTAKPPGATLKNNQRVLHWDFGPARNGVILTAEVGQPPAAWAKEHRCRILAEKTASSVGRQTWTIVHLEGAP